MARENRELVMLAEPFDPAKHRMAGMYLSEKLDGMRALWLPATRGKPITDFQFANVDKKQKEFLSTGLWSRYGNPLLCPEWFTVGWPSHPLDGELYMGRKKFEETMSVLRKHEPIDEEWAKIKYHVFEKPQYRVIFANGRINNTQYKKQVKFADNMVHVGEEAIRIGFANNFDAIYRTLQRDLIPTNTLCLHPQRQLPFSTDEARKIIFDELDRVTDEGGEGLILRHPGSEYETIRSKFLLKVKKLNDAEAMVVGYRAGQGKFLGMLGSLTVKWQHGTFELSGFTDAQRKLNEDAQMWALSHPGDVFPDMVVSDEFPYRSVVTFRYRELTADKMPKEGRFLRKYVAV